MNKLGDYTGNSPVAVLDKMVIVRELQAQLGMTNYDVQKNLEEIKHSPLFIPEDLEARNNISVKLLDGLYSEMLDYSLQYSVPMYFILGKNDWQVPDVQGIVCFQKITAPDKKIILIDEATHSPQLEKTKEFLQVMREVVERSNTLK